MLLSPKYLTEARQRLSDAVTNKTLPALLATWSDLNWVITQWIPCLLGLVVSLDMVDTNVARSIYHLLRGICEGLGLAFANQEIRPLLQQIIDNGNHLEGEEEESKNKSNPPLCSSCHPPRFTPLPLPAVLMSRARMLPALLNGFLVLHPLKDVVDFVKAKFIGICVGELNWRPSDLDCMVFATKILWY